MSKIKAALVTVLLGSSTAAMAAPGISFTAGAQVSLGASVSVSGPIVRDHRSEPAPMPAPVYQAPAPVFTPAVYQQPAYQQPVNELTSWISLGSPMSLLRGRDVIRPNLAPNITQIRLQASSGMSYIQTVQVRFKDGSIQNVNLNQWLTTRAPMAQFDLTSNCRAGIDTITVIGSAQGRNASYQMFAQGQSHPVILPPRPVQPSLTGTFDSVYGTVFLTQTGNHLHGTYPGKQGVIDGTIVNGVATYSWTQPDGHGFGTFRVSRNGNVEGTWGNGTAATGAEWDLTRIK